MKPIERMTGTRFASPANENIGEAARADARHRCDRFEWSGAFGDLGSAVLGGVLIILGAILPALALFFSGSIQTLFRMFPMPSSALSWFSRGRSSHGGRAHRSDRRAAAAAS